uniref:Secreted protein n=1 Tax=Rhipicephalus appendiculatus TaxID=34631 RepID=A0A131YCB4_RHIAP
MQLLSVSFIVMPVIWVLDAPFFHRRRRDVPCTVQIDNIASRGGYSLRAKAYEGCGRAQLKRGCNMPADTVGRRSVNGCLKEEWLRRSGGHYAL